jgi:3'-5' exoribonuclease
MPRTKPTILHLSEMKPEQHGDFFALLLERSRGATRDNKPFYTCRFGDGKRTVTFMVWSDSPKFEECERDWREGQFYKIRGTYGEHERYGPQIEVQNIRPATEADRADGFDPGELVEASRFDRPGMFAELRDLVAATIQDGPLKCLVLTILDRHADPLQRLPASQGKYYPFVGGLLEHTLSVTRHCLWLTDRYIEHYPHLKPPLNRDLIVAGAVLHDIGRVLELDADVYPAQPTVAGRLLGHLFLARDLIRDTAQEIGEVDPELLQLLEHLVITHLQLPEWGSPRLPLIPECLILHHVDDLDAKMEMYVRCLTTDQAVGPFTDRNPVLGKQLFKGRKA